MYLGIMYKYMEHFQKCGFPTKKYLKAGSTKPLLLGIVQLMINCIFDQTKTGLDQCRNR